MLFGHQSDNNQTNNRSASSAPALNPLAIDPDSGISLPAELFEETDRSTEPTSAGQYTAVNRTASTDDVTTTSDPSPVTPPADIPTEPVTSMPQPVDDALLQLKLSALEQLGPLVNHLDQTPQEKFRTTMMMIQSSDNQALISTAYEVAQQIGDDKARAQALLDIVNEINYFTQKKA